MSLFEHSAHNFIFVFHRSYKVTRDTAAVSKNGVTRDTAAVSHWPVIGDTAKFVIFRESVTSLPTKRLYPLFLYYPKINPFLKFRQLNARSIILFIHDETVPEKLLESVGTSALRAVAFIKPTAVPRTFSCTYSIFLRHFLGVRKCAPVKSNRVRVRFRVSIRLR